jgi:5'-nucleotidase
MEPSLPLVICITSTALFDCDESHRIWLQQGLPAYKAHQAEREHVPLAPGVGFSLVQDLLRLNSFVDPTTPLVEVVITSRNDTESGRRLSHSIEHHRLAISRSCYIGGTGVARYLDAWRCDLFLSTSEDDVREALETKTASYEGIAAGLVKSFVSEQVRNRSSSGCLIVLPTSSTDEKQQQQQANSTASTSSDKPFKWLEGQVRIAFDGDGVLFSDEAEKVYKERGPEGYQRFERENRKVALPKGPMHRFAVKLQRIRDALPEDKQNLIRVFLVTARNDAATARAIETLTAWNLRMDEAFFLGGWPKTPFLRAINPAIFFDDTAKHVNSAEDHLPAALVPFGVNNTPRKIADSATRTISPAGLNPTPEQKTVEEEEQRVTSGKEKRRLSYPDSTDTGKAGKKQRGSGEENG